jgi:predicted O-methyltransferase YrrM
LTIAYNKEKKKHELHITQPYSSKEVEDSVQAILQKMEPIIEKNMDQLFHDLFFLFSKNNLRDVMIEAKSSPRRKAKKHAPVAKVQSELPPNFSPRYESEITSWHPHRGFAYDLIRELNPQIIVELGVHFGDSYFTFCQACEELELNTQLYGIDHWQGDEQAGFFGDEVFEEVSDYETEFYEENSTLIKTNFDDALGEFSDGSIDLLHIDGSHEYENIRNDFHNWLPKMRKGGKILIHDILVEREDFGVRKFWNEISQTYKTQSHPEGFGLGIVNC